MLIRCLFHLVLFSALTFAALGDGARPNVLFIFSDDQRADTIAALGNAHIRTPNLDRLVEQGTTFTNAYCMGSMQGAVCVPSRAMLMSGRTLFRVDEKMLAANTWPQAFGQSGYRTFATGKWHNSVEGLQRSFQEGKAIFRGGMGDPNNLKISDLQAGRLERNRTCEAHASEVFANAAIEFIRGTTKDRPWLCYLAFTAPHDPRIAPAEIMQGYRASPPPVPKNFLALHPFQNGELLVRDERLLPWPRTQPAVQGELSDYYACIEFLDAQIGRVLDALEASGQRENTLIAFASDHGLAIGSHGLLGKQNLYEHSTRAPLILAGPGIPGGKRTDALCYLLDIYPTIGELASVKGPQGGEGQSLKPVLKGEGTGRKHIFTAYRNFQRAYRDGRWKFIRYPEINRNQLFDLETDPSEEHDLASDPHYADRVAGSMNRLAAAQKEFGDTLPLETGTPKPAEWTPPAK